jgi:hypothetical protein
LRFFEKLWVPGVPFTGEQTNRRKQLSDKLSKTVLGHNVEKKFQISSLVRNAEFYLMGKVGLLYARLGWAGLS